MQTVLRSSDWIRRDGVWVRGRAFESASATGSPLEADALASHFEEVRHSPSPVESTADVAATLEGFFAGVIALDDSAVLVADGARSIPLYYAPKLESRDDGSTNDTGSIVSDNGRVVRDAVDASRDPVTESEFLLTRYVTGPETVWEGVFAVQPGEVVHVSRNDISRRTYREHWPGHHQKATDGTSGSDASKDRTVEGMGDAIEVLRSGLETALDRLEAVAGDRTIVVPLSGGYDSRLLAAGLVERGREVVAFTFGRSGHPDVEVSREVAARLGIRWEFCEYDRSAWREWYHSEAATRYRNRAFGGDALPFLAGWPAVRELTEAGRLPRDGLYCPGHTVATPSERLPRFISDPRPDDGTDGGCTPKQTTELEPTVASLVEYIVDRHYALWPWDDNRFREAARTRIRRGLLGARDSCDVSNAETASAAYERWEWRGRLSTFTNGDLRIYEDCGVDWWLPLWDPAYVRAWCRLPLEFRANKRAHVALAIEAYLRVANVSTTRAKLTDRTLAPIDRMLSLVRYTPCRQYTERKGRWDPPFLAPRSSWNQYRSHPLAWEGAVERGGYEYLSTVTDFYGMRTLEAMGRLDFENVARNVVRDGTLQLPTSE